METRKLETFLAVAETRSFTKAAQQLRVVQSGVSTSVRLLERELGGLLFDRTTQRVELTEAGKALVPQAQRVLAAVHDARQAVREIGAGQRGTLRLGILYGITPEPVRQTLARFRSSFPNVEIQLSGPGSAGSADHIERVREGVLDLAVVITIGSLAGVSLHALLNEQVVLACPPDHRLAGQAAVGLADVVDEPVIDFPLGWGVRSAVDRAFSAAGLLQRRSTFQMNDMATMLELVRLRMGLAFVPGSVAGQAHDLHFLQIRQHPPSYQIALAAPRARELTPVAAQFLRIALGRGDERMQARRGQR